MYVMFNETATKNRRNGARGGPRLRPQPAPAKIARPTAATPGTPRGGAAGDSSRSQFAAGSPFPVARECFRSPPSSEARDLQPLPTA